MGHAVNPAYVKNMQNAVYTDLFLHNPCRRQILTSKVDPHTGRVIYLTHGSFKWVGIARKVLRIQSVITSRISHYGRTLHNYHNASSITIWTQEKYKNNKPYSNEVFCTKIIFLRCDKHSVSCRRIFQHFTDNFHLILTPQLSPTAPCQSVTPPSDWPRSWYVMRTRATRGQHKQRLTLINDFHVIITF